jgi:hypothetical protein
MLAFDPGEFSFGCGESGSGGIARGLQFCLARLLAF